MSASLTQDTLAFQTQGAMHKALATHFSYAVSLSTQQSHNQTLNKEV
jgi:hypothetical protein